MQRRVANGPWAGLMAIMMLVCPLAAFAAERVPEIWMVPLDQFERSAAIPGTPDYLRLFDEPPAPGWQEILGRVNVWKLYFSFAHQATDAQLRTVFAFLRAHRIALALEYPPLTSGKYCVGKIEGFGGENLGAVARRFASLGGRLDYLAMDEPLFYGHHFDGRGACRAPIATLAADIAANVAELRTVFPELRVGDIEPGTVLEGDWETDIAAFLAAYQAASGEKLAFLHVELGWSEEWAGPLRRLAARADAAGVPFGVIYNGSDIDGDDARWAAQIEENYTLVEDVLSGPPANAVFQSWVQWPTRALPATDPLTATGILARYLRPRPAIAARRESARVIAGVLTGAPGGLVHLEARGFGDDAAALTIAGRVPPGAARALLGARFNAECGCSGRATMRLGVAHYHDAGGHDVYRSFATARGPGLSERANANGVDRVLLVEARPDRPMGMNTPAFPVSAGQAFDASFALSMDPGDDRPGYVTVIWLDGKDKEFNRVVRRVQSAWREVASATADRAGGFRLTIPENVAATGFAFRLRVPGTSGRRPVVSTIPSASESR